MPGEAASQAQEHKTADRQASTMEAEAAKFLLQATVTQICHSSRDIQPHSLHPREQPESNPTLWRPWILTARDAELGHQGMSDLDGDQRNFSSKGALGFQHPVRETHLLLEPTHTKTTDHSLKPAFQHPSSNSPPPLTNKHVLSLTIKSAEF
ncbi:protein ripply3 isoform X2 [Natator depressus]|uniref:protein ripply3 isoform X2 n=1 Tax=Natator depressus TaxID=27790 RepID=UPI003EB9E496